MIRPALTALCLLSSVLWSAGCSAPAGTVQIPLAPAWQAPADARPVTAYDIRAEVARVAPLARLQLRDATYTRISHAWLEAYVSWTWQAAKASGIHYTAESFDCENFTGLFNEIARLKAAAAGQRTAPLLALVVITQPVGAHALVGVATDRGLYIVEPQPAAGPFRIKPVADYAGRILEVEL